MVFQLPNEPQKSGHGLSDMREPEIRLRNDWQQHRARIGPCYPLIKRKGLMLAESTYRVRREP